MRVCLEKEIEKMNMERGNNVKNIYLFFVVFLYVICFLISFFDYLFFGDW